MSGVVPAAGSAFGALRRVRVAARLAATGAVPVSVVSGVDSGVSILVMVVLPCLDTDHTIAVP
jgi:hypothetical protein